MLVRAITSAQWGVPFCLIYCCDTLSCVPVSLSGRGNVSSATGQCLCMYIGNDSTPAHTRTRRTQARGATPELQRVADTASNGLSAGRHPTQTTTGSPSLYIYSPNVWLWPRPKGGGE